jgi:molecular chaperone DnaK
MQTAVTIKVYQGERKMAAHNRLLGEFNLEGLPPAPRGVPQIEVKFDIDQNGILNVGARDLGTHKEATVRIEQSAGLSDTEIDRMRHDAESHAEEDRRQYELVEARNQADQMCYQLEKLMRENADKLGEKDRSPLEKAVRKTRDVAKENDTQAIRSAISELEQASQAFSKTLYERAQAGAQSDQAGSQSKAQPGSGDDDAIDAEFEVKD